MNPMASSFYLAIHATVPHMYFHPRKIKPSNPKNRGRFPRSFFLLQWKKGSKFRGSQNRIFFRGFSEKNQEKIPWLHLYMAKLPRNLTAGTWSHDGFQSRNLQTSRDWIFRFHVKFQGCTVADLRSALRRSMISIFSLKASARLGFEQAGSGWWRSVVGGFRSVQRKIRSRFFLVV